MNNPFSRTLLFAGVAAGSVLIAVSAWYASQPSQVAGFADVGQPFFPDFTDVEKAKALTVAEYDGDEKEVIEFSVRQNDTGLWVIPSHHDYPAEAEERLARTATSLLGVEKTAVQSRSKDDWKLYGVADPTAEGAATAEERGTRLTLSDTSGNPLVDLIIGQKVKDREQHYYVREPEKNTTYIARLEVDLSAKFSDWIEPDLLKMNSSDLVKVVLDNYSIDEQRGTIDKKEVLEFQKKGLETSGEWQLTGLKEDAEELDKSPVQSIATNLDQLKIVGVRPKPAGLDDNLRVNPAVKQILQMQMQTLGYFIGPSQDGGEQLYANEGEVRAGLKNGVEYTLYFGEIARGTGKEIEVGLEGDAAAKSEEDAEAKDTETSLADADDKAGPRRYLLIKTAFNENLLGEKPVEPFEPVKPEILNEPAADAKPAAEEKADAPKADAKPAAEEKADAPKADAKPAAEEKADAPKADAKPAAEEKADAPKADPAPEQSVKEEEPEAKPEVQEKPADAGDDACGPADETTSDEAASDEAPAEKTADEPAKKTEVTEPAAASDEAPPAKADAKPADSESPPAAKEEAPVKEEASAKEEAPAKEEPPAKDPRQVAQEQYDAAVKEYEAAKKAYESQLKAYEDKVQQGKEKAEELSRRFAGWYYVISSDSFEKFRVTRKDVVSAKAAPTDEAATPPESK